MALRTMLCFAMLALALVSAAPAPGSGTSNSTGTEEGSGTLGVVPTNASVTTDQARTHDFNFNCNSSTTSQVHSVGSLRTALMVLKKYASHLYRQWGSTFKECAHKVSFQSNFDVHHSENTVTAQHLANWYGVFGSYAKLAEKARNASCSTVDECGRMETLSQVLIGVLEDYNKVLTPEFCSCDQQDCISVPSPQPHIPSDCELAAYIEYNLYRWEVPLSQLIRNNWRKSQDYENIIISPREWISEHGLSSASDYATIAYLYSLQL